MKPVLLQMQPRELEEPIKSIRQNVNIPRVWFRAFNEYNVCKEMNEFIRNTNYTHYIINSDDVVVYKQAIDTVLKYGKEFDVFTGWVNMHMQGNSLSNISNVCLGELKLSGGDGYHLWPQRTDYPKWYTLNDMLSVNNVIQTSLASFALSCFTRDILLQFPLSTYANGCSSDHHISIRLQKSGVQVFTHRDSFCLHLRQGWSPYKKKWLVGNQEPEIIKEIKPELYNFTGERDYLFEKRFTKESNVA